MRKFKAFAASIALVSAMLVAISGTVFAGSPGQLAGGDNYVVKNVTKASAYSNSVSATCDEVVQYSMQISNTHFGALNNVTMTASLPANGGTSTAVVTTDLGGTSGTSDTASVSIPANATQTLVNGTTILYDGSAKVIKTLPDTITSGVNIGTLAGSTTEFVNFRVKVTCKEQPPVSTAECKVLDVKIYENRKVSVKVNTSVNNATIIGYKVDFGDGTVVNTQTAEHTYAKDGTYKIVSSVQVKYYDGSTKWITSDGCAKEVTFSAKPMCKVKGKENLPADSPDCKETPKCTVKGKENLPADSKDCKEVVTPPVLPNTGAGSMIGIFTVVAGLSTLAYSVVTRKFGMGQ